jgi:hypothetical protein
VFLQLWCSSVLNNFFIHQIIVAVDCSFLFSAFIGTVPTYFHKYGVLAIAVCVLITASLSFVNARLLFLCDYDAGGFDYHRSFGAQFDC